MDSMIQQNSLDMERDIVILIASEEPNKTKVVDIDSWTSD